MSDSFNPFTLVGKRVLVTGASSGIGREIAISSARMGATVIGIGRDEGRLNETLATLVSISGAAHQTIKADLTQHTEREQVIASLDGLAIDGLAHSAGISRLSPVRQFTEKHMRELQAINVEAPMLLTQGLLKRGLVRDGGSILFIASIAAHIGVAGVGFYSGTKAALLAIARSLAMEVAKRGIRSNCLSPALVKTPLLEATATLVDSMSREEENYPLGFGKPEDVANAAIYFLSDASKWVTGTTLVMDGGLTIT